MGIKQRRVSRRFQIAESVPKKRTIGSCQLNALFHFLLMFNNLSIRLGGLLEPGLDVDNGLVLYPENVVVKLELPRKPVLSLVQNWEALAACKRS